MIKGILFDKDGTIIDFFKLWQPTIKPVLERLILDYQLYPSSYFLPKLEEAIGFKDGKIDPEGAIAWKPYPLIAKDLGDIVLSVQNESEYQLLTQRLSNYFSEAISSYKEPIPTFTDMVSLFSTLKKDEIAIGIVTTDDFKSTWDCMEELGIDHFISFIGTSDNSRPVKPDGELVAQAARLWSCDPTEIMVIGDTPNDMRFANNGNAIGVAVTCGTGDKESLSQYTPYIIPSLKELLTLLDEMKEVSSA